MSSFFDPENFRERESLRESALMRATAGRLFTEVRAEEGIIQEIAEELARKVFEGPLEKSSWIYKDRMISPRSVTSWENEVLSYFSVQERVREVIETYLRKLFSHPEKCQKEQKISLPEIIPGKVLSETRNILIPCPLFELSALITPEVFHAKVSWDHPQTSPGFVEHKIMKVARAHEILSKKKNLSLDSF